RKESGWENIALKHQMLKRHDIISLACDYYPLDQKVVAYAVLRSSGIVAISIFATEKLNLVAEMKRKAKDSFDQGLMDEAETFALEAIAYSADDTEMLNLMCDISLKRSDHESFLAYSFQLLRKGAKESAALLLQIGSIYEQHGFSLPALAIYRTKAAAAGDQSALHEKIVSVYEKHGLLDNAISVCREWFKSTNQIQALLRSGRLYELTGQFPRAENEYLSAIDHFPYLEGGYLAMARAYLFYQLAGEEEIMELLDKVISINPNSSEGYTLKGYALLQSGKFSQAESSLIRAVKLDPGNGDGHLNLAELYHMIGKEQEMTNELSEAGKILGDHPRLLFLLALAAIDSGDLVQAISHLEQVVAADPYYTMAHYHLAEAYQRENFFDSALFEYQNVLKISPDFKFKEKVEYNIRALKKK
ncbi:MAG: tetratricopeptide repeat protein, partial [Candidatus Wallbacteria bacterium]|nr:tetratricopeptide repeat protein [Candidatus Wallbacteria bacterium]